MCGIAGLMAPAGASPDLSALDRMEDALAHRGPDGRGRHVLAEVAIAQRRLAIIDLETGGQPIYAEPGNPASAAIVANAEVYNYLELRKEMRGRTFSTRSDCEPPLHLYLEEGAGFAERLRGMYAIAIHDPARELLVLARDPFGIKPLYYAETAKGLAFASEPQALLASGLVPRAPRPEALVELLQMQFTSGRETVFAGIRRVLPGETLLARGGRIVERRRRAALPADGPGDQGAEEALAKLDAVLADSVEMHQRSDVPYGMFFSGGVDSSALLAMMTRLNERPVLAFTAGFAGSSVPDEREHARRVARTLGAEHVEVTVAEDDLWRLLPPIAAAIDDPAADYAVLPTYKLAERARAAGLKVVLTGEGGDELFAGYGRYRRLGRWRVLGGRPMRAAGALEGMGVLRERPRRWRDAFAEAEAMERTPGRTPLQAAQAADCATWLADDLLVKLDRCLMAHGVEGRVPFVDPAVAEFAFRLPDRLKIQGANGKWLLRAWLAERLPAAAPFSKKRGFTVPVGAWIAGRGKELGRLVAKQAGVAELCRPQAVEELFRDLDGAGDKKRGQAAWLLLFFALWHRRHGLGLDHRGDVFETLSAPD